MPILRLFCALLLIAAFHARAAVAAAPADFYVSPRGSDAWSGRLAAPNRARTDGPFATLERAQAACRAAAKARQAKNQGTIVQLRGGTYFLRRPLRFTPEDGGTAAAPVVYEAYPGETPLLSGGEPIAGWEKPAASGRPYYTARLADAASGNWNFAQLWVNGQRRFRPRLPKNGYYYIAGSMPPSPKAEGKGFDRFKFTPGEINPAWSNLRDVEVLGFQIWTMVRLPIDRVDAAAGVVTLQGDTHGLQPQSALPRGNRYLLENVKEALRDRGEWYLDRPTGTLSYIPVPGEKINVPGAVVAPRLEQLLILAGTDSAPVEYLTFRGLRFAHTNGVVPPTGYDVTQAEVNVGAAIAATRARHCVFTRCAVEHVGGYAIELAAGSKNNRVEHCRLSDLGAGGVKIGETRIEADDARIASGNVVRDCLIEQGGRVHPAAVGVWVGHSYGNVVRNNAVADFYYTGVSLGWSWGYSPTPSRDNRVLENSLFRLGQGVLSDLGGIYTLGLSPGSVLEGNVISDIRSYNYGGWGIYFDEGTAGMTARNNIVYRTKTGGFHQHYGRDNRVTNNIFAYADENGQLIRTRPEEHRSFTLDHNIVLYSRGDLLGSNWTGSGFALNDNLYWNDAGKPVTFAGRTLAQWRAGGQDSRSVIADPLFAETRFLRPYKGDFRLKPGSPALKLGFVPIDASRAGPRPDPNRRPGEPDIVALAKLAAGPHPAPRAFPAVLTDPPAMSFGDNFEDTPAGARAADAVTNEENPAAAIRVTADVAHAGKQSLRFSDAPGQTFPYSPHLYYEPRYREGSAYAGFFLRMEPGAELVHEWRDAASPYHVGPSFRVDGKGDLYIGGQRRATLPHGKWVEVRIRCGIGAKSSGKYQMAVRLPDDAEPLRFNDLPCDPGFRTLDWFGFIANATETSTFYLDDFRLSLER